MNKTELIKAIADNSNLSKKDAKTMLVSFCELIKDCLNKGEEVRINGFGKFEVKNRTSRTVINPKTKEKMIIPETKKAYFKVGSELNDAVMNN